MNYYTLPKEKINKLLKKEGMHTLVIVIIEFVIIGIVIYALFHASYYDSVTNETIPADRVRFSDIFPMLAFISLFVIAGLLFLKRAIDYFIKWPKVLENNPEAFVEHFRFYRRDGNHRYSVHLTQQDLPSFVQGGPRNQITYLVLKWEEEQKRNQGVF